MAGRQRPAGCRRGPAGCVAGRGVTPRRRPLVRRGHAGASGLLAGGRPGPVLAPCRLPARQDDTQPSPHLPPSTSRSNDHQVPSRRSAGGCRCERVAWASPISRVLPACPRYPAGRSTNRPRQAARCPWYPVSRPMTRPFPSITPSRSGRTSGAGPPLVPTGSTDITPAVAASTVVVNCCPARRTGQSVHTRSATDAVHLARQVGARGNGLEGRGDLA